MFGIKQELISLELSILLMHVQAGAMLFVLIGLIFFTVQYAMPPALKSGVSAMFWRSFTILSTAVLSYAFYTQWGLEHLLLSVEYGVGLVLSIVHPINALCFFAANQFLRPWEVMHPNDLVLALPRLLGGITLSSWFIHDLLNKELKFIWNLGSSILVVFAFWVFITTFKSPNPDRSQEIFFDGITRNIALFFLVLNMIRSRWELEAAVHTVLFSVAGVALSAFFYAMENPEAAIEGGRLKGLSMMGNSNDLAALMMMVFPVMLMRIIGYVKNGRWMVLLASLPLSLFFLSIIWWSKSRGALVALGAVTAEYGLSKVKSKKGKWVYGILIACGLMIAMSLLNRSKDDIEGSSGSRMLYWKTAVYMAIKNPLLGVGYASYPLCFEKYAPETPIEWGHRTAHSSWFLVLGETSFFGLFLYILLFTLAFRAAWKIKSINAEIFALLLGYTTAISFLSHSYLIYPYFVLGLALAAERVNRHLLLLSPVNPKLN